MIRFAATLLGAWLALAPAWVHAQERLKLLASFSILADIVRNIGGERVEVSALVGPNGDAHVYAPSPADAKKVAEARLVVVNGLGFEGWIDRLVKASGGKPAVVVASRGVKPRKAPGGHGHAHGHGHGHSHGASDPHAWQSVPNVKVYAANVRDALVAADPAGKTVYEANATAYLAKLDALDREVRAAVAALPKNARRIVTNHDAFAYFAAEYGLQFLSAHAVSTDAQPSARDVARIVAQIKKQKIPAVFLENISDPRLAQRIAEETGTKVGGTLYSDALTDEKGPAPTYIDLIRHNIKALSAALTG